MNPYTYQKVIHKRTVIPPIFNDYRKYKPYLSLEFKRQCVYCRALEKAKGWESFGVDHYRPKAKFPLLSNEYLNLFYSCNRCNGLKRDYWPTDIEKKTGSLCPTHANM